MNSVRPGLTKVNVISDRTQWPTLLANHVKGNVSNPSLGHGMWRHREQLGCDEIAAKQLADPVLTVVFIPSDVGGAISCLKNGKTLASDRCSAEMLKALSGEPPLVLATRSRRGPVAACRPPPLGRTCEQFSFLRSPGLRLATTWDRSPSYLHLDKLFLCLAWACQTFVRTHSL